MRISLRAFCFALVLHAAPVTAANLAIDGSYSYEVSGDVITLNVAKLSNNSSGGSSGTIRLSLFATTSPYSGGSIAGYTFGDFPTLSPLPGGYYYYDIVRSASYTPGPADGTYYYITLLIEEYTLACGTADGFCIVDYGEFNNTICFGNCNAPPPPPPPPPGGLQNTTCSNNAVVVKFWDHSTQDNDRVTVTVNGETLVSNFDMNQCGGPGEPTSGPCIFTRRLPLNSAVPVTIFAHNEGSLSPNTAALKVIGSCTPESQAWELYTGESASIVVYTGNIGVVPPSTPLSQPVTDQSAYTISTGQIPLSAVQVSAAGTFGSATLRVNLDLGQALQTGLATNLEAAATYNVYVLALVPGQAVGSPAPMWFVKPKAPAGWGPLQWPLAPFLQGVAVGSADNQVLVEILSSMNITALAGTEFYIGYGISDQEMLAAGRYRGIFKAQ